MERRRIAWSTYAEHAYAARVRRHLRSVDARHTPDGTVWGGGCAQHFARPLWGSSGRARRVRAESRPRAAGACGSPHQLDFVGALDHTALREHIIQMRAVDEGTGRDPLCRRQDFGEIITRVAVHAGEQVHGTIRAAAESGGDGGL